MNYVDVILGKIIEWIDMVFSGVKRISGEHSPMIPIVILVFLATKIFKIRLDLGGKR